MDKVTTNPVVDSSGEVYTKGRDVINKATKIPEQYYLSIAFLGAMIVFRSASLQIAVRTVISLAALFILWQIIMLLRAFISAVPVIVISSFVAVATGTITSSLFSLIPFWGMSTEQVILPEQLYLLLCVPVLIFQAEHRIAIVRYRTLKSYLAFSGLILLFAAVRELLGDGRIFGIRIMPEAFPGMTFFRHLSSTAFLLAATFILAQWIYRKKGKGCLSFANPASETPSGEIPYLQTSHEKTYLCVSLLFLVTTVLSGVFPIAALILYGGSVIPIQYLLSATVLTQGMMIGLIYIFARSLCKPFSEMCERSFIIPTQTMILLLPFYITKIEEVSPDCTISCLLFYFAYLVAGWIVAASTILFVRLSRRKLIFGRRPVFIDGLTLSFIMLGICLIILSGFASILVSGMFGMFIP